MLDEQKMKHGRLRNEGYSDHEAIIILGLQTLIERFNLSTGEKNIVKRILKKIKKAEIPNKYP